MKYKMIAVDLDGTLCDDRSEITERTNSAVQKAIEAGILFVISTGRAMCGVERINALFDKDLPFITLNGAVVVMGKSLKVLASMYLDFALAKEVFELGVSCCAAVVVWTDKGLRASRECEETRYYRGISNTQMTVTRDFGELKDERVSKVLWIGAPDEIDRYRIEMNKRYAGKLNCYPSRPEYLDFVSLNADKAIAMEEIGRIFDIDKSEMIAVGDGYNDISMLKYAGLGVAMENAPDDVKAVCGYVTLSNNEDGVAAVIEKFLLAPQQTGKP